MDLVEMMMKSEAIEISLRNGHVVYGKFLKALDKMFMIADPDGNFMLIPNDQDNISYIKLISADPEISKMMDILYGERPSKRPMDEPPPRRVDVDPVILDSPPANRQAAIEAVKERYRHNTSFTTTQGSGRPAYKPRIEEDK